MAGIRLGQASGTRVFLESLFWFGLPGVVILACVYWLVPALIDAGIPLFLLLPMATQWVGNTWFAVMVHAALVSLALILIVGGII